MSDKKFTPDEIARTLEDARAHIRTSGGKKTPGIENRHNLIAIIEQYQRREKAIRELPRREFENGPLVYADELDAILNG